MVTDLRWAPRSRSNATAGVLALAGAVFLLAGVVASLQRDGGVVPAAVGACVFAGFALLAWFALRVGVFQHDDTIVMETMLGSRRVDLSRATRLTLKPSASGQLFLYAWSGGRHVRVVVVGKTRSLPAAALQHLAEPIAESGAKGADELARALRDQAAAVRAGRSVEQTPLGRLASARASQAAVSGLLKLLR